VKRLRSAGLYLGVAVLGFAVGGAGVFVVWTRSGPPLEIWHHIELESEFQVEDLDEVRSFGDYQALEGRLFAELDEKVYAHTETGPRYALARYSRGSIADPHGFEPNWNASFEFPTDDPRGGVLLLHGMSDSPYSLRSLGHALHARGYWVIGLRLPGHGTAPSGLKTATWEDMSAAVSLAAKRLAEVAPRDALHMVGYSTGAPLAILHSLRALDGSGDPVPASLVLVSPAIAISPAAAGASWLRAFSRLPGLEQLAWTQILPEFDPFKYNSFAVNAGDQVHRLTRDLVSNLEQRAAEGPIDGFPRTIVFLSTVDATVSADAVIHNLLENLAPRQHELVLFDVNRSEVKSSLLVSDPGPMTLRLLESDGLPFALTVLMNHRADSSDVDVLRKTPFFESAQREPLGLPWPVGVISLSHVALPFPVDDPLYGERPPDSDDALHLGHIAFQGERGLLRLPDSWLIRIRHNPFYEYLERRSIDWIRGGSPQKNALRPDDGSG
jgi:alpha-beta hydrolase superfamily lysophospholipase